jgi:HEAT repeat protein
MLTRSLCLALSLVSLLAICSISAPADPERPDQDIALLNQAKIATDSASVLKFVSECTGKDADMERIQTLIDSLGRADFQERERGTKDLTALGPVALPHIRNACKNPDREISRRALRIQQEIHRDWKPELRWAAIQILMRQRPDGLGAHLLRFLPYAGGQELHEEIWYCLDDLAKTDEANRTALESGLGDKFPERRAVAACILAHRGNRLQQAAAGKLLADADAEVRLRASQGFLAAGQTTGIPVLIELLKDSRVDYAWQAEELLHWSAGDDAPGIVLWSGGADARRRCYETWLRWWNNQGQNLALAQRVKGNHRPILFLAYKYINLPSDPSRVWLGGSDAGPRWNLKLHDPQSVEMMGGGRLLVAQRELHHDESDPAKSWDEVLGVTLRDLDGRVIWQYPGVNKGIGPWWLQRLPNGNIFVSDLAGGSAELSADGKEVSVIWLGLAGTGPLQRHRDGLLLANPKVDDAQIKLRDPAASKIVRSIALRQKAHINIWPPTVEVLRNGNYLFREGNRTNSEAHIYELDTEGRSIWRSLPCSEHAVMLRNGNMLVSTEGGYGRVVEIDRQGKVVQEMFQGTSRQHWGQGTRLKLVFDLVRLGFDGPRLDGMDLETSINYRVQGLASHNRFNRLNTAAILYRWGRKATPAIPTLIECLADDDEDLRKDVFGTLQAIGPATVQPLLDALKDKRSLVRLGAAWVLQQLKVKPDLILPVLLNLLDDKAATIRRDSAAIIGMIGPQAKDAVPALIGLIRDHRRATDEREHDVLGQAICTLGNIGAPSTRAVPEIVEALHSKNENTRIYAAGALGLIGPGAEDGVWELMQLIKNSKESKALRGRAAMACGCIGATSPQLIEALRALMEDSDEELQSIAKEALMKLS